MYNSYELLRKQYKELFEIDEVFNIVRYNKKLLKGIPELHLFETPAGQANLENEFTPDQQWQNLNNARNAMNKSLNKWVPTAFNKNSESVLDIRQTIEAPLDTDEGQQEDDDKPEEENKCKDTKINDVFDEFTPFERSSVNQNNIRNKIDLGYSTMNYRTSLIPKVKTIKIKRQNKVGISEFDKLIMQHVKTSDPYKVTEALLKEISRINTQIIEAKNKLYKLIWLCYDVHVEIK